MYGGYRRRGFRQQWRDRMEVRGREKEGMRREGERGRGRRQDHPPPCLNALNVSPAIKASDHLSESSE